MSDEIMDVSAESSPAAAEPIADPSQATTQPAPAPVQPKGFHEHPDWQSMVRSRREDRQAMEAMRRELAEFKQARQQSPDAPLSQEETQAIQVLKKLMARDPELAAALGLAKQLPQFQQRFQGMDQLQAQAARAHTHAAKSAIKELAATAGLKTDDESMDILVPMVAGAAARMPDGNERYSNGDLSVFSEAFNKIKPWLENLRKPADAAVAQTKFKTKTLPPAPRGSAAGSPAPVKATAENAREVEADMHRRAKDMLAGLQG